MALPIFIGEKMAKHILSCSFGKDSIATALLALQHGEPLDELVYCEVMFSEEISGELPEHNRFIHETAIPYFEQRGIPTRVLRSEKTYLSCFYHVVTRGKVLRKVLMDAPLLERPTADYIKMSRQIAALGNNLNQLAHIANASGKVSNTDLLTAKQIMEQIWRYIKGGGVQ